MEDFWEVFETDWKHPWNFPWKLFICYLKLMHKIKNNLGIISVSLGPAVRLPIYKK